MTLTIEITPEEAARLRERAARQGRSPEELAHGWVAAGLGSPSTAAELPAAPPISEEDHERLVRRLMASGLMTERPTRPLGPPPPPIRVQGRPVSETIIEERR